MAKKYRVKAYFMHENEESAARNAVQQQTIADAEWTAGYVMGIVDQAKIKSLTDQGLVVTPIEEVVDAMPAAPEATAAELADAGMVMPGIFSVNASLTGSASRSRSLPVAEVKVDAAEKVLSSSRRSDFYVVRFHGPLTEERSAQLRKKHIQLLERVSRNKYTVHLAPSKVKELAVLPFVDSIRVYTAADTMAPAQAAPTGAAAPTPRWAQRTRIYTVLSHRPKDLAKIKGWLSKRGYKPLWKGRSALRVALVENSKDVLDLAKRPEVANVEMEELPRTLGDFARPLLRLEQPGKPPFPLEGDGELIGIADTGLDSAHPDFAGRIAGLSAWGRKNDPSDPEGHGTHVAGCALGDGHASNGKIRGAAPKAKVFFQSILDANGRLGGLPEDLGQLFKEAYDKGARIHNNSWGAFALAQYTTTALQVDRFVHDNPDMLIVIAVGNDGTAIPRPVRNSKSGFVDWPCVAAPATAKNGLTVGASRSSRTEGGYASLTWGDAWGDRFPDAPINKERISGDAECLAAFSSRGPCNDQRIKPDIVAPGTDIAAARSKDAPLRKFWGAYPQNNQYGFMGGTSMAAPYVAGCAALVRQWYRTDKKWTAPSAALLKATLINGTQRLTGADAIAALEGEPNYHQGFGRIDMSQTLPNPSSKGLKLLFEDTWQKPDRVFAKSGQRFRYEFQAGAKLPLRLCLTWTDPPARALQHALVLLVDDANANKWIGNVGAATLLKIAGATSDPQNNVQVVRIAKPIAGRYTIAITASNLLMPPQSFALVITGDLQSDLTSLKV